MPRQVVGRVRLTISSGRITQLIASPHSFGELISLLLNTDIRQKFRALCRKLFFRQFPTIAQTSYMTPGTIDIPSGEKFPKITF
jgi:hypothetical protein